MRRLRSDPCIPFICDGCLEPIRGDAVVASSDEKGQVLVLCGPCLPTAAKALRRAARIAEIAALVEASKLEAVPQ